MLSVLACPTAPAFAGTYLPGVKNGDWAYYGDIHSDPIPFGSIVPLPEPLRSLSVTQSIRTQVEDVSVPNVNARQSWRLLNQTSLKNVTLTGNLQTGAGNLTGWIIAANLNRSDVVQINFYGIRSAMINDTVQKSYWGKTRTVDLLNTTQPVPQFPGLKARIVGYWDRSTGFLMDFNLTVSGQFSYTLVSFNAWVGVTDTSFSPNPDRPEFSLSANPTRIVSSTGITEAFELTLKNTGRVSTSITVTSTISPVGPTVSPRTRIVPLAPGISSIFAVTVAAASIGNYTILVTGTSDKTTHSTTINLIVKNPSVPGKTPDAILGMPQVEFYTALGVLGAGITGGTVLTLSRRKRSRHRSPQPQ